MEVFVLMFVGWACECAILNSVNIHWCQTCNKWTLANQDWRLLSVSSNLEIHRHLQVPRSFSSLLTYNYAYPSDTLRKKIFTGPDILQAGQPSRAMLEWWAATIWYTLQNILACVGNNYVLSKISKSIKVVVFFNLWSGSEATRIF